MIQVSIVMHLCGKNILEAIPRDNNRMCKQFSNQQGSYTRFKLSCDATAVVCLKARAARRRRFSTTTKHTKNSLRAYFLIRWLSNVDLYLSNESTAHRRVVFLLTEESFDVRSF